MVKTDSSELVSPGTNFLIDLLQNMGPPSVKFRPPPRDEIMKTHKHISLAKFEPAAYLGDFQGFWKLLRPINSAAHKLCAAELL